MSVKAHYHLRFAIMPGPEGERCARALADFCKRHGIEEVALIVREGHWYSAPLSPTEVEEWSETLGIAASVLRESGISVSLNLGVTVGHSDNGRHMHPENTFSPMVSPQGERATAQASFACPLWQSSTAERYGRLAKVGFRVMWLEDDFRYHNHPPLQWGGDFSGPMLGRFGRRLGRSVSREEVVAAILKPGEPHPWRNLWMETWREAQLEVVGRVREAVHAACPSTRLGLMSSHPSFHSIEGRDWGLLFESLSIGGEVAHRPSLASWRGRDIEGYTDVAKSSLAQSSFLLDVQKNLKPASLAIEVSPEIENATYGPYAKSDTVTWGQMALAQLHGADALLLNLFSPTCRYPDTEPWVGRLLDRIRPGLDALADMFPSDMATSGVGVPWRPDASLHVRTSRGQDMDELYVPLTPAADVLQSFGVAVQARPGKINCLWGAVAWAFSDAELRQLLASGLWLDGIAAEILQLRGFGRYLPVEHLHWWGRQDMDYGLEFVSDSASGLATGTWLDVSYFARVACQEARLGATEWTGLCNMRGRRIGCGVALFQNSLGGRVATCAWPLGEETTSFYLSTYRQILTQRLVTAVAGDSSDLPTMVTDGAYVFPVDMSNGHERRIALFNASLDPQLPRVLISGAESIVSAHLLCVDTAPRRVEARPARDDAGVSATIGEAVPFCGLAVLQVE